MKPNNLESIFEPRAVQLARAIVNVVDVKKIQRDVKRLVDTNKIQRDFQRIKSVLEIEKVRKDAKRVKAFLIPDVRTDLTRAALGPMIRCSGNRWHKLEGATVVSELTESGLEQKIICGHKVSK